MVEQAQHGTVTASATKAREGDTVTLTVLPSEGYRLESLSARDASKKAVDIINDTFTMPASDVTISATFEAAQHTIAFKANGGTGTMADQTVETGESATLNANKFTRTGYTFNGWNTAKDGSGTSYKDKATVTPTDDMTLYAQWKKKTTSSSSSTTSTSSTSGTSASTLARTADSTSAMYAITMLASGASALYAGIRRKRR